MKSDRLLVGVPSNHRPVLSWDARITIFLPVLGMIHKQKNVKFNHQFYFIAASSRPCGTARPHASLRYLPGARPNSRHVSPIKRNNKLNRFITIASARFLCRPVQIVLFLFLYANCLIAFLCFFIALSRQIGNESGPKRNRLDMYQ